MGSPSKQESSPEKQESSPEDSNRQQSTNNSTVGFAEKEKSNTGFHYLKQLKLTKKQWRIKAVISRMWDGYHNNTKELMYLNVVLMDENEDQIHGMVPKDMIDEFRSILKEGATYIFENMNVSLANKTFRLLDSNYVLYFNKGTTITSTDEEWPRTHKFKFIEFEDLEPRENNDEYLTDVIGNLTSVRPIRSVFVKGRRTTLRDIMVENNSGTKVRITFWDEKVKLLNELVKQKDNGNIVIIATSTRVGFFEGYHALSSTSATQLYINLDIPEVEAYKEGSNNTKEIEIHNDVNLQVEEKVSMEKKTISELIDEAKGCSDEKKKYTCEATIMKIYIEDGEWHYMSCKFCRKKVYQNNDGYSCATCRKDIEKPIPKYKLKMKAEDDSGTTTFVAFDKEVESQIMHPVTELCEMFKKKNGVDNVKRMFEGKFLYTKYVFQLRINNFMRQQGHPSFTVSKIFPCEKEAIKISEDTDVEDEEKDTSKRSKGVDSVKRTYKRVKIEDEEDDD